jgi:histidine triad (HIT) family protein
MAGCIFCKILARETPGSFVYEDELVAAFMDIRQPNPYKVLVVPRAHVEVIYDLSAEQAAALFQTAVRIARAIRDVSGCDGLNVFQSNGAAAGQVVPHVHLHLLPRHLGPRDHAQGGSVIDRATLERLAADLRSKL